MHSITSDSAFPAIDTDPDPMTEFYAEHLRNISIASILESILDGIVIVNRELLITAFNGSAEQITGIPRLEAIGQRCSKIFRSSLCEKNCVMQKTFSTKTPILSRQAQIIDMEGNRIPVSISTTLLRNRFNEVIGGVEIIKDLRPPIMLQKKPSPPDHFDELITRNRAVSRIVKTLPKIATSQDNILITGEDGSGREVLARAIHAFSPQKNKPFIAVNCSKLPDKRFSPDIIANNQLLFGAFEGNSGCPSLTRGSTLFLNEICAAGQTFQDQLVALLRDLATIAGKESKSTSELFRIIASTSRNLFPLVKTGKFRPDLYCHINSIDLSLPPLRERREDIPLLIDHFITNSNRLQNKAVAGVNTEVMNLFMGYDFPGNIRELKNIITNAYSLCTGGLIAPSHLSWELRRIAPGKSESFDMGIAVQAVETRTIITALERNNYNRTAAARDLGIHKSTFFRKIKHLGIVLPKIDGRFRIS